MQAVAEKTLAAFQSKAGCTVSAAIVEKGKPVFTFGPAEAVYPLYSLTKPAVAWLVVTIAAEKSLPLDAPIGVLPTIDLPPWVQALSVEHLLNHTSGLRDYGGTPAYSPAVKAQPPNPWSPQEFLTRVAAPGPAFVPGEGFQYCNPGYMLLVHWLMRETGKDFAALFRDRLAEKLKLPTAFVAVTAADLMRCAPGWSTYFTGAREDIRPFYHPGWVSHGLIAATVADAARMLDHIVPLLMTGRDIAAMRTLPFDVPGSPEPFYHHGLMGDRHHRTLGHNGGGPGYNISAFKRDDTTLCVICDTDTVDAEDVVRRILASIKLCK